MVRRKHKEQVKHTPLYPSRTHTVGFVRGCLTRGRCLQSGKVWKEWRNIPFLFVSLFYILKQRLLPILPFYWTNMFY